MCCMVLIWLALLIQLDMSLTLYRQKPYPLVNTSQLLGLGCDWPILQQYFSHVHVG